MISGMTNESYHGKNDSDLDEKRNEYYVIAEQIMADYEFIITENKKIYFYLDGYYRPNGDIVIKVQARRKGYDRITNNGISEIIGIICDTIGYVKNDYFAAGDHKYKVCIKNGVLDLETGKLLLHNKKYKFTAKLPLYYNPKAFCPNFAKFLRTSLDADPVKVTTILEMIGHCLMRDNTRISKIFLHVGSGSNGKSVLFKIVQKMLGEFYSTKTIHSLASSNFAGSELIGRHANICADIGSAEIKQTDLLKRASAGDAIDCEEKYKTGFPAVPYATLIFSANELPDVKDETDGFARRIEVIEWSRQFFGKDKDPAVTRIVDMPDEISGILNMILIFTARMIKRGSLKYERTVQEMKILYKEKSDSVYLFGQNELIDGADKQCVTVTAYSAFVRFCKLKKYRLLNDQAFSRKMKERGYTKERKKVAGTSQYYWIGTSLRSETIDKNQTNL